MTNCWSIIVFNAIIALPLTLAILEIASLLWCAGYLDHGAIQEACHLIEGLGVVLIGWGVVLEERDGMSRLLGGGTHNESAHDPGIDTVCHDAGLSLLVLGLIAEVLVQCVEVPDHIIKTDGLERVVLTVGDAFLMLGLAALIRLSARLATLRKSKPAASPGVAISEARSHGH
ncbi:hypothetical protein MKK84_14620 [Methylobacterium sp. E-065]|uniref:hypothetical protein n=1 Tax=Methylobacterium sp. E-065 TaxID=2836583 RepID=UPI001FB8BF8B|nr:hypothetical protein [Methylobacterium sp. E-065]MCJ2018656.1 hypothetical protein [Methylobacterium sp. E-065]